MDMVSRNEKGELYVCGTNHYPGLKQYVSRVADSSALKVLLGHDKPEEGSNEPTNQSDHYEFHKKGIPFLYFGVEDYADYHRASDEFEKIDPRFYYQAVQTVRTAIDVADGMSAGEQMRSKVIYKQ